MSNIEGEIQEPQQKVQFNLKQKEAIESEFRHILSQFEGDQSLASFKVQYEKLYKTLKKSHDNQKVLYNKTNQLSRDMANQNAKLRVALKLSQQDAQAISFLKQQLEKTLKILELSKQREERAKQKTQSLNSKIKIIEGNLEQFKNDSDEKSNSIVELKNKKEQLTHEKNQLNDHLAKIKGDLGQSYEELRTVEGQRTKIQSTKRQLEKDMYEVEEKLKKDKGRQAKIKEELDSLKAQKDNSVNEGKKFEDEKQKLLAAVNQKQYDLQKFKEEENVKSKENQLKAEELRQLKFSVEDKTFLKSSTQKELAETDKDIERCKKDYNNSISTTEHLSKENDKLKMELVNANQHLTVVKKQNEVLMNSIPQIHREIMDRKKLSKEDQKEIQKLDDERNTIQKELLRKETQFKISTDKIGKKEEEIVHVQRKIDEGNQTIENIKKDLQVIEKEKEAYGKKAAQANAKYLQSLEEIKLKGNLISQFQKKNIQTENKLKEQQKHYERVRSDRNSYSKQVSETQDQIAEIKRKYKIVNHQINQLKEQIQAKEVALAKEKFQHKKKDQTLLEHGRQLEKRKIQMENKKEQIKNFHTEISKLHSIIRTSQGQRQKKKDEYQLVVAERDILGTQLIRRNDQSALLYEKIKIQQTTLAKGETAFRDRMRDMKLLITKKKDLNRQLRIHMKESKKIPEYKQEIFNLQSQLIEEKLKVKALSEELENPLNIHRCRSLQGNDPDSYEMNEKIKTLQKRLIYKTEQVVEKEVMVHQKQKQIQQLRQIMRKQPGLDIAEKLSLMQRNLNVKTKKMKQLAAQINMYQAKTNQFKYDIERTQKQIQEIKRKYNEQKKREQITKQNQKLLQQL